MNLYQGLIMVANATSIDISKWHPAAEAENYNPDRFDFRWNQDETAFRLVPLDWWDQASYLRYQGDPCDYDEVVDAHTDAALDDAAVMLDAIDDHALVDLEDGHGAYPLPF